MIINAFREPSRDQAIMFVACEPLNPSRKANLAFKLGKPGKEMPNHLLCGCVRGWVCVRAYACVDVLTRRRWWKKLERWMRKRKWVDDHNVVVVVVCGKGRRYRVGDLALVFHSAFTSSALLPIHSLTRHRVVKKVLKNEAWNN